MARTTRPTLAPPTGPVRQSFLNRIDLAKRVYGIDRMLWSKMIGCCYSSVFLTFEGDRPATHLTLSILARIAAVLDLDPTHVVDHPLPDVPTHITLADLHRIRDLSGSPLTRSFVEERLQQLLSTDGDPVAVIPDFAEATV